MVWTKETLEEFLKQNPQIKTRAQFKHTKQSAYDAACRLKLMDYFFEEKPFRWTPDNIREFVRDNEITTRVQLQRAKGGCYRAANRFKMLDELFGKLEERKYNWKDENTIYEFLKDHPNIRTRMDLLNACPTAYKVARIAGILDEICENDRHTWNETTVREFVKSHPEITTRSKLIAANLGAYKVAKKLNLLQELFGDPLEFKSYSKEEILDFMKEHPEIKSRKDLKEANSSIFTAAAKKHMLVGFFGERVYTKRWNRQDIEDYLKEHPEITSRTKLQKSSQGLYNAALRLDILEELFGRRLNGDTVGKRRRYTKEDVIEYLKDNPGIFSRSQLCRANFPIYNTAKRLNLLDELFGEIIYNDYPGYVIYAYEFPDIRYAYIGLSVNYKKRDGTHRDERYLNKDSLQKFCKERDLEIPEMKILLVNLNKFEAVEFEREMWLYYKKNGWNLINYENNLGKLGSPIRWNLDAFKKFLERHPDIKNEEQFQEANNVVYKAAKRLNMLKELFPDNSIN